MERDEVVKVHLLQLELEGLTWGERVEVVVEMMEGVMGVVEVEVGEEEWLRGVETPPGVM